MLDLLPLSEELKEKLIEVLREVVKKLAQHDDLYSTIFRLFFTELGKLLTNSEGLDSKGLIEETNLLMGTISEHILSRKIVYELVDSEEDDIELD
jgi:hypothetical protein